MRNLRAYARTRFARSWWTALFCAALSTKNALAQPVAVNLPAPITLRVPQTVLPPRNSLADNVRGAALRFGIPEHWIYAVMRAESAGRADATSRVGAMGLMQIMPATWAGLTARYALGSDAYDRRANIMGGAAYIRETYDRYGAPGFLAAYNAGPGRYENYLTTGRPLPLETRNYVAKIAPAIGYALAPARSPALAPIRESAVQPLRVATALPVAARWTNAPLFASNSGHTSAPLARSVQSSSQPTIAHQSTSAHTPEQPASNRLFAPLSGTSL